MLSFPSDDRYIDRASTGAKTKVDIIFRPCPPHFEIYGLYRDRGCLPYDKMTGSRLEPTREHRFEF